jgi:two-component system chemotaxis response regulator CheY
MRSLIVDDEPAVRRQLTRLLSPFGPCDSAGDGTAGLEIVALQIARNPHDLICLDVTMNGLDGLGTLKEIRRLEAEHGVAADQGSRVVMVTGMDQADMWDEARRDGCCGYLPKPISRVYLLHLLADLGLIRPGRAARGGALDGEVILGEIETWLVDRPTGGGVSIRDALRSYSIEAEHSLAWMSLSLESGAPDVAARHADALAATSTDVGARTIAALCTEVGQAADAGDPVGCRAAIAALQLAVASLRSAHAQRADGSALRVLPVDGDALR